MTSRRLAQAVLLVALVAVGLALPSGASAHHLVATATIDATLGPATKTGEREMTVTWTIGCGQPGADVLAVIARVIKPKSPAAKPLAVDPLQSDEQGAGSARTMVSPGSRNTAAIEVECRLVDDDENRTEHVATASAESRELSLAPRLNGYTFSSGTICGFEPTRRVMESLQVGQQHALEPKVLFNSLSMLRSQRHPRGITLRIRGGGLNARVRSKSSRRLVFVLPKPRRAGRARVWVEFDGTRTNAISIRVLRRAC